GVGGGAGVQGAGAGVPEDRVHLPSSVAAVGGLGLGADLGGLLGLLALGLGGAAAGVLGGAGVQLDLGVRLEQVTGDLVGVDPQAEMEGVVDGVLAQLEGHVEHVVAARPAEVDAVGRVGVAVAANGVGRDLLQDLLVE